jgi:hypothetical protein
MLRKKGRWLVASEARQLANVILASEEGQLAKGRSPTYYHRVSGCGGCVRAMALHAHGEPPSDETDPTWGTKFRFDQGHDAETRVVKAMRDAGIHVLLQQLTVEIETPMGAKVPGHIDGVVCIPHHLPLGGYWFVMDVKSIGTYGYIKVFDEDTVKKDNQKQVSIYACSTVVDTGQEAITGVRLKDVQLEGYEFGGGLIAYLSIDRPTRRVKGEKLEYPKFNLIQFDIPDSVDEYLDLFDEVDIQVERGTLPPIPDAADEMVWGGWNKAQKSYKANRCLPRWCQWYSVCQQHKNPQTAKVKEII